MRFVDKKIIFFAFFLLFFSFDSQATWSGTEYRTYNTWTNAFNACETRRSEILASGVAVSMQACSGSTIQLWGYRPGGIYTHFLQHNVSSNCSSYTYTYSTGQCSNTPEPATCPIDGNEHFIGNSGGLPNNVCHNGCQYIPDDVAFIGSDGTWSGTFKSDGNSCSDQNPNPDQNPPSQDGCYDINGKTMCNIQPPPDKPNEDCMLLNGVQVCTTTDANCGDFNGVQLCHNQQKNCGVFNGELICAEPPPPINPNQNYNPSNDCMYVPTKGKIMCVSDFLEETTDTNTTTNPDGSTTTTSTTTNNIQNGGSSTTTTTTSADGNSSTSTTTESGGGLDSENKSSFSAGSCSSQPVCKGDALQCAIATSQWEANCTSDDLLNSLTVVDGNAIDGAVTDGHDTSLLDGGTTDLDTLDQSIYSLDSTCPAPYSITIMNTSIDFSYQPLCDIALTMSYFVVISSLLISARIIL